MKNLKIKEHIKYPYKKDESITILKETFVNEKNNSLHKYTAEKNSIFAKSFPSEEDAVKELNRKLNSISNNNNNQKQKPMSKLEELRKQLALSESQLNNPMISNNPLLKKSTENKIAELKQQISEMQDETETSSEGDNELSKLKKELELIESQMNSPHISGNPILKSAVEAKLKETKSKIANLTGGKVESQVKTQPVQKVEKKVEKIQKVEKAEKVQKVEKPKTEKIKVEKKKTEKPEKKKIEKVEGLKVRVGDKVTFEERETGKKVTGELVKLEPTHAGDAYNAYVMTRDGKKKVRAHKLTKV